MCEAGRIRHHLKHNLWRPESTIVFVGYQAKGTLGRVLMEGAKEVKLFGEVIEVKAKITKIAGISGHADKNGLLKWINSFTERPPRHVFVVHGEDTVCEAFTRTLTDSGYVADAPYSGTIFDLIRGEFVKETLPVAVKKKAASKRAGDMYQRLLTAGHRLLAIIRKNEGLSNKETAKFTDQINSLCDKWDRE
jgi:metallo-beta-lactamase family protein